MPANGRLIDATIERPQKPPEKTPIGFRDVLHFALGAFLAYAAVNWL